MGLMEDEPAFWNGHQWVQWGVSPMTLPMAPMARTPVFWNGRQWVQQRVVPATVSDIYYTVSGKLGMNNNLTINVNFGFPITPAAWGSVWSFLPPVWSGSVENRGIGILTVSRTPKSRSRSSVIVDHLLILYMYDHSSATRTKRIEVSLFFSQGISGQSCAKNSPFVLLRTRLAHL
jgi:hypothetical protein